MADCEYNLNEILRVQGLRKNYSNQVKKPETQFKLEKDVFHLVTSEGQGKKKILSLHKELNLRPLDFVFRCSTTEPQRLYDERRLL